MNKLYKLQFRAKEWPWWLPNWDHLSLANLERQK